MLRQVYVEAQKWAFCVGHLQKMGRWRCQLDVITTSSLQEAILGYLEGILAVLGGILGQHGPILGSSWGYLGLILGRRTCKNA